MHTEYQVNHKTQPFGVKVVHLVPNVQTLAGHAVGSICLALTTILHFDYVFIPALDFSFFAKIRRQWQLVRTRTMVSKWLKGGAKGQKIKNIKKLVKAKNVMKKY